MSWRGLFWGEESHEGTETKLVNDLIMPVISRFLEGGRVSTRGRCADSTKSWSSSWGSSDTAARARWARVCHAQPRWLL